MQEPPRCRIKFVTIVIRSAPRRYYPSSRLSSSPAAPPMHREGPGRATTAEHPQETHLVQSNLPRRVNHVSCRRHHLPARESAPLPPMVVDRAAYHVIIVRLMRLRPARHADGEARAEAIDLGVQPRRFHCSAYRCCGSTPLDDSMRAICDEPRADAALEARRDAGRRLDGGDRRRQKRVAAILAEPGSRDRCRCGRGTTS